MDINYTAPPQPMNPFAFGKSPSAKDAPKPEESSTAKELGAKTLQSATFGFGADAAEVMSPGSGKKIRGLADMFDQKHPLGGLALDLAVGAAEGIMLPGGQVAGAAKAVKAGSGLMKAAGIGAGFGALSGAGSGGDVGQRTDAAVKGAMAGGVLGPLVHGVVGALSSGASRITDKMGITSPEKRASGKVGEILANEGNLGAPMEAGARVADASPGVTALTKRATRVSDEPRQMAQQAAQSDLEKSQTRIQSEKAQLEAKQPFYNEKTKLQADTASLEAQKNAAYTKMQDQAMPINKGLSDLMALPTVKDAQLVAGKQWQEGVQAGLIKQPKNWTPDKDIPMSALDKLQRELASMREKAFKGGDADLGKHIDGIHSQLLNEMKDNGYSFKSAFDLSAQLGGMSRAKDAAYDWGRQFSHGLSMADRKTFDVMSPWEKQHAKIGFTEGMEDFLTNPKPLSHNQLTTAATALESPELRGIMGTEYSRVMSRKFRSEAARIKTSSEFASPVINREEAEAGRESALGAYSLSKLTAAPMGQMLSLAAKMGMSEAEAKQIVKIATAPNGAQKLQEMGVDKRLVERARAFAKARQMSQAALVNRTTGETKTPSNAKE